MFKQKRVIYLNEGRTSWVYIFPNWATKEDERQLTDLARQQGHIKYRWNGTTGQTIRKCGNFSDGTHIYNNIEFECQEPPDFMRAIMTRMEQVGVELYGKRVSLGVLNLYQDSSVQLGFHSDMSPSVAMDSDFNTTIFSLSFGYERELSFQPFNTPSAKDGKPFTLKVHMPSRALVIMGGRSQYTHKHAVLGKGVTKRDRDGKHVFKSNEERVNFTARLSNV